MKYFQQRIIRSVYCGIWGSASMSSQVSSLLQYFKRKELSDPDGPLSQLVHLRAITSANREVQEEMKIKNPKKRNPYIK